MKGKRIVALVLAGCLTFGQTVWAADVSSEKSKTEETQQEEQNVQTTEGNQIQNSKNEQENISEQDEKNDTQTADKETTVIQSTEEQSNVSEQDFDPVERQNINLYVGQNQIFYSRKGAYSTDGEWNFTVKSDNEEICKAELIEDVQGNTKYYYVRFIPLKAGKTDIIVNDGHVNMQNYHITVKEAPADRVVFNDIKVERCLIQQGVDANGDGYISKAEMKSIRELYTTGGADITDLTGLEYAENLERLYLNGNEYLTDIDVILRLKKLNYINLQYTGVSTVDKWKIAKYESAQSMSLGDKKKLILNGDIFDEGELSANIISGDEIIEIQDNSIVALATGETVVELDGGDEPHRMEVKVNGILADQNTGTKSDATIKAQDGATILGSNGELWTLYPKKKKVSSNVKNYVGGWIYAGSDGIEFGYHLKKDNTLWSGDKKLADNIKNFSGRYALNNKDELIDIYDANADAISDVKEWNEIQSRKYDLDENMQPIWHYSSTLYVLKTDGTLWTREEVQKGEIPNELKLIAENVKELDYNGYLLEKGGYISFEEGRNIEDAAEMPKQIGWVEYYVAKNGHTYINVSSSWDKRKWVDLGNTEIVTAGYSYWSDDDFGFAVCYQTKAGEVYRIKEDEEKSKLIAQNVKEVKSYDDGVYIGTDGLARTFRQNKTGTKEDPVILLQMNVYDGQNDGEWTLEDYGVPYDYNFVKNGVLVLTHVKEIFWIGDGEQGAYAMAIRTDGTVWNVEGVPEQVLDLNTRVIKGDLDGDNEVNITDLRTILRAVCEKETLTETQTLSADVNEDGRVDIQDLRKVLRFVCGKEEAL